MKKILQILLPIIIFFIVGYLLGVYCPLDFFSCNISNEPITKGDYYGNIINFFGAFGTCLAVVVALFLDEIRSIFKKVDFTINLFDKEISEELEDIKGTKKATRYHNSIQIFNDGNVNAQNCELYVEMAKFTSNSGVTPIDLSITSEPLLWMSGRNNVYIPCQGKKVLQIFEVIAPQKQSTPDSAIDTTPAKLNILGIMEHIEPKSGQWSITYCLYSTNSKPKKFEYIINWTGEWENRQKEMKQKLTVKLNEL